MADKRVSFAPKDFSKGGVLDDALVEITDAKCVRWDYGGKAGNAIEVPALAVEYTTEDGAEHLQYYSAGDIRNLVPSEDGITFEPVTDGKRVNDSSNCGIFLTELVNVGFPEPELEGGDITVIVGCKGHVKQKAVGGTIRGQERKQSVLVFSRLDKHPFGTGKKASKASAKAKGKPDGEEDVIATQTVEYLKQALTPGEVVEKKTIASKLFKTIPSTVDNKARQAMMQMAILDEFLSGLSDSGILYDKDAGTIMAV